MSKDYFEGYFTPRASNPLDRKVRSMRLETWVRALTLANVTGHGDTPQGDLGCPVQVARNKDGSVRFNADTGRPVERVAKSIVRAAGVYMEKVEADLNARTDAGIKANLKGFKAEVEACQKAGLAVKAKDTRDTLAAEAIMAAEAAQAEAGAPQAPAPVTEPADAELAPAA